MVLSIYDKKKQRIILAVIIVAIIENIKKALSFLTDSSKSWFGSVLSNVLFIPIYVHHNNPVPAV